MRAEQDYLFVNPFLHPPGGGEGVANWMLEVLSRRGRVTVLTWDPPDFQEIDRYYGTALAEKSTLTPLAVAPGLRKLLHRFKVPHHLLGQSLLARKARALRDGHRLCFSAFNEMDLGPPALQYVHCPGPFTYEPPPCPWPSRLWARLLWPIYISIVWKLQARDLERIRKNITVANSEWTARLYQSIYGGTSPRVIFPPPLSRTPTSETVAVPRREAFLSIARLDRSKEWPKLVEIIRQVRARGHELGLTLVGSRYDSELLVEMESLRAKYSDWLSLELDQPRSRVDNLISQHRYGIHGMVDEHYGMAVAELVLGGCTTFVHDSGGQVEIVPQAEARYTSVSGAVSRICAVLEDPDKGRALAEAQAANRERLTRRAFLESFEDLIDELEGGLR